jgi:hypothetical protein
MYFIVSCLFNLGWILIELMIRQGHEQCWGGPSQTYTLILYFMYVLFIISCVHLVNFRYVKHFHVLDRYGWILIELMIRQGHEQCWGGPSLSLI